MSLVAERSTGQAPGHPDENLSTKAKDMVSTGSDVHAMVQRAATGHSEEKLWREDLMPAGVVTHAMICKGLSKADNLTLEKACHAAHS